LVGYIQLLTACDETNLLAITIN